MMPYDSKCLELAQYFLAEDYAGNAVEASLAQQIQDTVEDWFAFPDGGQIATQVPNDASSKQASEASDRTAAALRTALEEARKAIVSGCDTVSAIAAIDAALADGGGQCDHKHWDFQKHGRICTCGAMMVDAGD